MNDLPLALAVTAGSVAAFNPCGFALLPAYLSMLLGDERGGARRALGCSAAMTAGFVTVFGLFGLVVTLLSLAVALARGAAVSRMRRILPYIPRISGALLILAGLYVAYYGWYELRVFAGEAADDPIIGMVTRLQGALTGWLEALGPAWIAFALAMLLLIAIGIRRVFRR
ncbi:cytochrome c biogenesis CcdA family protein [Nonomuraea sp. NPDC059023]|uniref:cytochrome c biogenesis CcdA family protein n=1 Tax=unclassified Nonomuraea TaxID=2593643 RepID=UPI00369635DF